jgi:hypothetical protein
MSEEPRITAFNNIFEGKLSQMVKDIKKIRKDPTKKDKLERLRKDAKELRKIIKKEKKKTQTLFVDFGYEMVDGKIEAKSINASMNVSNVQITSDGNIIRVNFEVPSF